jgi:thymidine kinase
MKKHEFIMYTGPMWGSKTTSMLLKLERLELQNKNKVIVIFDHTCSLSSDNKDHSRRTWAAFQEVSSAFIQYIAVHVQQGFPTAMLVVETTNYDKLKSILENNYPSFHWTWKY